MKSKKKPQENPLDKLITYLTWRKNIWSESLLDEEQKPSDGYRVNILRNDDQYRGYIKGLKDAIAEAEKLK